MTGEKVVIAGAGVIGLTAAWQLHRQGANVTVLEAGRAGREASWAGGGILWPIYPWRYPASVQALAEQGARLYPALCTDLAARTGIDPQWRRTGVLVLDRTERAAAIEWAKTRGWRHARLEPEVLAARVPGVNADEGAVYFPEGAQVRNPRLCRALAAALRAEGVAIREHTPVREAVTEHGRFAGFRTDDGVIAAPAGVIAAGAWSSGITGAAGMPPVDPVKGQMLLFSGGAGEIPHVLVRRGQYVIPRADGRVLVGSTVERQGFGQAPTGAAHEQLRAAARGIAPALSGRSLEMQWSGLRPATVDGEPFVDAVPGTPGLFASIGHYRNGLVHAPAAAQWLARRIFGSAAEGA